MKRSIFFVFLIITFITLLLIIQGKIHCGTEMGDKACFARGHIEGERVYFVNACKPGEYCPREYNFPLCSKMARQAEKGEKCIVNTDCLIGKCVKGSCKVEKAGQPCDYDENCDEISICSADGEQCASMKALGDPCSYSTDCKIGLECAGLEEIAMVCIKIATAPSGYIAGTELACQTGYTITNENGLLICVNFKKTKSCEKKLMINIIVLELLKKGKRLCLIIMNCNV